MSMLRFFILIKGLLNAALIAATASWLWLMYQIARFVYFKAARWGIRFK
jgi:hypothetical protein